MWIKVRREQGELDEMAAMEAFRSVSKLPYRSFMLLYSCICYCCPVVVLKQEEENEDLQLSEMMELGV